MKEPLKILVVEDSPEDTTLLLEELHRGGFEPAFERVDCFDKMHTALGQQAWDVVVSDHSMPGFGCLDALALLKTKQPEVPFIVVSGSMGEEQAVGTIKAGANDYVMKGDLTKVVPAIVRELREAKQRYALHRAEESMAHLAAIVESSEDAIIGKTLEGVILSWNGGAEAMYGYTPIEVIGGSVSILIPAQRQDELRDLYGRIRRGTRIARYETVRLRKDGTAIDVSLTLSPIKDRNGKVIGVSAIERDITALKREQDERLELIRELTEALGKVNTLKGLLPICASCKKIRDDGGYWQKVESYISAHTGAEFTHGICPDCVQRLYPDYGTDK